MIRIKYYQSYPFDSVASENNLCIPTKMIRLKHPPYSPDLAPMDFAVFPYIKSFLRGQRFDDLLELRQEVMNIILNMKTEQFEKIFDDWLKRCKKCVELNGDYVEKS